MIQQSYFWVFIQNNWKQDLEDICTLMFIAVLFTITKKAMYMSIDAWMNKQDVAYPYNGILFSFKRENMLSYATTWVNAQDIMLSEII